MRVCFITTSYPSSIDDPAGHFVAAEVRKAENEGAAVTVIHPRAGGAFGWPGVTARIRERPVRAFEAAAWGIAAAARVRRAQPDRIVAHWSVPSAFPIASSTLLPDVPLEIVSHGGDVRLLVALPGRVRSEIVQRLARRAERWRFVSQSLKEELEGSLDGADAIAVSRVAVVAPSPLGEMEVAPSSVRELRALVGDRPLYVCASRLVPSKRIDKVIDYVASGARERSPVLVVLGDGPQRAYLEELAHRWRIDARFLGITPRTETLSWISAADEFVHASRVEGFSTVLREAEHLGVKVTRL